MLSRVLNGLDQLRRIPGSFLLAMSIVLALVLFLPDGIAEKLSVKDFREAHREYVGPAFLLVAAFAITKTILTAGRCLRDRRLLRQRKRQLHQLSAEEKGYLCQFVHEGKNTICVAPGDGVAGGLVKKCIIYEASDIINILDGIPYNLQPWAMDYLIEYPNLLAGAIGKPLTTEERVFGRRLPLGERHPY